ncbi:MAG: glycine/sarcosine/betaine reductase selenoprotein B family protein [Chloroflexota bacterium]|jgi:D-proline reductase (dithiol) PrdB|nr:glycine/sarcosine/betaine reductase selenoprotein B family protein [Chloroflexota bacterium]MEC9438738.1 glycine/sarcosine/betaine reductase selenoprotein B family protein [Chloroflexota bacterium]MQF65843.1 hypothetical protein [SAR202 cluster bacterium AC-647-P02_OGT_505m]|tara:strand:- start:1268 stop:1747 length:480 start_codon:yes stop_codon:yes gene_type:complete
MPRLEALSEAQRKMLLNWPCPDNDDTPWTTMGKPLSESKVAMVTTSGIHLRKDAPFRSLKGGDTSYRIIPRDSDPADIIQSHTSIGFDRTTSYRDINISFPVDRLEELVQSGYIGELSNNYYSYMGAINDVTGLMEDSGPEVATKLLSEEVDVVLLVPT